MKVELDGTESVYNPLEAELAELLEMAKTSNDDESIKKPKLRALHMIKATRLSLDKFRKTIEERNKK